jgi:transcriptional regulator with XRE-family HTH domain
MGRGAEKPRWTATEIFKLRARYGYTQEQLANKLKVGANTVRQWEQRRAVPSPMACKLLDWACADLARHGKEVPGWESIKKPGGRNGNARVGRPRKRQPVAAK